MAVAEKKMQMPLLSPKRMIVSALIGLALTAAAAFAAALLINSGTIPEKAISVLAVAADFIGFFAASLISAAASGKFRLLSSAISTLLMLALLWLLGGVSGKGSFSVSGLVITAAAASVAVISGSFLSTFSKKRR